MILSRRLFTAFFTVLLLPCYAQLTYKWSNNYDNGNIISISSINSISDLYNFGSLFTEKVDRKGNIVWRKDGIHSSEGIDRGNIDFAATSDLDNTFFVGTMQNPRPGITVDLNITNGIEDTFKVNSKDGYVYVGKIDGNGDLQWGGNFYSFLGEEPLMRVNSFKIDASENIYIAGKYRGDSVDFDPNPAVYRGFTNKGGVDGFVLKLDTDGQFVWLASIGGNSGVVYTQTGEIDVTTNLDNIEDLAIDDTGNVLIIGKFDGTNYVRKIDAQGQLKWSIDLPLLDPDGIYLDDTNAITLVGRFSGTRNFHPDPDSTEFKTAAEGTDTYFLRLNPEGRFLEVKTHPAQGDVNKGKDGNFYVVGGNVMGVFKNDCFDYNPGPDVDQLCGCYGFPDQCDGDTVTATHFVMSLSETAEFNWVRPIEMSSRYLTPAGFSIARIDNILADKFENVFVRISYANFYDDRDYIDVDPTADVVKVEFPDDGGNTQVAWGIILCDSNISYDTISRTACLEYTSPSRRHKWTTSGRYVDTIDNYLGCDSIVTIDLTILGSSAADSIVFVEENCHQYIYSAANDTLYQSGIYYYSLTNSVGCDSAVVLSLTLNNTPNFEEVIACDEYVSPSGRYKWTTSGQYVDTLITSTGCDSVISIDLTIKPSLNTDIALTKRTSGDMLKAEEPFARYQWLNCTASNEPIQGAIDQFYTPTESGTYAVVVSKQRCIDTSNCVVVINVPTSTAYPTSTVDLKVYPNPVEDILVMAFTNRAPKNIWVKDITGRTLLYLDNRRENVEEIDVTNWASGTYLVTVQTYTGNGYTKFIKK